MGNGKVSSDNLGLTYIITIPSVTADPENFGLVIAEARAANASSPPTELRHGAMVTHMVDD